MNQLLVRDAFRSFLLLEAVIETDCRFAVSGKKNPEYYDQPRESGEEYVEWERIKPFCAAWLKGRTLPLGMKIVLKLNPAAYAAYLGEEIASLEEIQSLTITILYQRRETTVTTGCMRKGFSLDHSVEQAWDRCVEKLLALV